ncbi:MAG: helix-turn-helix transcriptional regulator [Candidatus Thorarchaeota archaeon]
MGTEEGVEKIFFELASENRLAILRLLQASTLKMQDIAREIDVTPTESLRQLQRLGEAGLVQRQPDGSYTSTQYGTLVLRISASIDFLWRHREYFSKHDLLRLPPQFNNRIGELSGATLILDTIESLNIGQRIMMDATEYAWGIAEGHIPELMGPIMDEKVQSGLGIRMLIPHSALSPSATPHNVELRGISEVPLGIALTESSAVVSFRFADGGLDYAGFSGTDPIFLDWAKDLFLYYWNRAREA